jgi:hypothetical protein
VNETWVCLTTSKHTTTWATANDVRMRHIMRIWSNSEEGRK